MALYSDPPPLRPFSEVKPTLLVCWWITSFCAVIIALRVIGRFIRSEKLFSEDKTAALALVPLFLRMGCVHVILIYGTNNVRLEGAELSDDELHNRSVASGLVLLSRVFYAATYVTSSNPLRPAPVSDELVCKKKANRYVLLLAAFGSSSMPSSNFSGGSISLGDGHMTWL